MSKCFEHREALPGILTDVHKQAAVAKLREAGADFDDWDPERVAALNYEPYTQLALNIVELDDNRTDLRLPLFGSFLMRIEEFEVPTDWIEHEVGKGNDAKRGRGYNVSMQAMVDIIESPARMIRAQCGGDEFDKLTIASIFVLPGRLPCAVPTAYVDAAAYLTDRPSHNSDLLSDIETHFDPGTIEYLPEDTCAAIAKAIRASNPHIADM